MSKPNSFGLSIVTSLFTGFLLTEPGSELKAATSKLVLWLGDPVALYHRVSSCSVLREG